LSAEQNEQELSFDSDPAYGGADSWIL
jgi:hypothetical protein